MKFDPREFWSKDATFSDRKMDYKTNPFYSAATAQIRELMDLRPVTRIVDIGTGSGGYPEYLARVFGVPVVASDIPGPRLDRARAEHPHLAIVAADAIETLKRFNSPETLFTSINVFGAMPLQEVREFFEDAYMVTFCERGSLSGDTEPRVNVGWDHNYPELLRAFSLVKYESSKQPKFPDREAIVATVYRS